MIIQRVISKRLRGRRRELLHKALKEVKLELKDIAVFEDMSGLGCNTYYDKHLGHCRPLFRIWMIEGPVKEGDRSREGKYEIKGEYINTEPII